MFSYSAPRLSGVLNCANVNVSNDRFEYQVEDYQTFLNVRYRDLRYPQGCQSKSNRSVLFARSGYNFYKSSDRPRTGISKTQVDLKRRIAWVHPNQVKATRGIAVPLNADAILVLRQQQGKHPRRVFTYQGRPVKQVNTAA